MEVFLVKVKLQCFITLVTKHVERCFIPYFFLSFNAVSTLERSPGEKFEKWGKHVKSYLKIAIFFSFWPKSDKI